MGTVGRHSDFKYLRIFCALIHILKSKSPETKTTPLGGDDGATQNLATTD